MWVVLVNLGEEEKSVWAGASENKNNKQTLVCKFLKKKFAEKFVKETCLTLKLK